MRIGTLVLACAVCVLIDVGPRDREALSPRLLLEPLGLGCSAALGALLVWGAVQVQLRSEDDPTSAAKVAAFSAVVSSSTVLAASMGKAMLLADSRVQLLSIGLVYLCIAGTSMAADAKACAEADTALYVPMNYCAQLVLNCLMGLCVWGDGAVVANRFAYAMVYCLFLLGVYEVSTVDLLRSWYMWRSLGARLSEGLPVSAFGTALERLAFAWAKGDAVGVEEVRAVLEVGSLRGAFADQELIELALRLLRRSPDPRAELLGWAEEQVRLYKLYASRDPDFIRLLEQLARHEPLLPEAQRKLGMIDALLAEADADSPATELAERPVGL